MHNGYVTCIICSNVYIVVNMYYVIMNKKTIMKIQKRRMDGQVPVDFVTIPRHVALVLEGKGVTKLDFSFNEDKNILECKLLDD